jgi:hypothetical protein
MKERKREKGKKQENEWRRKEGKADSRPPFPEAF